MEIHLKSIFLFSCLLFTTSSQAVVLDFSDLTLGTTYIVGDNFTTSGVNVLASDFQWSNGIYTSGGFAQVGNAGLAGGSGLEMAINNINLNFALTSPVPEISLLFGEYGGNLNLLVNGTFMNVENFNLLPASIGGANVSVINGLGNDMGSLTLTGNITSFAIGGQELWIDDVNLVPVPAAVWLFISGLTGLAGFSRLKKR